MHEYLSKGIILNSTNIGVYDVRVSVFTKKFGKIKAKATSARKITSKLAGHIQPAHLSHIRIIEKKGLRLVDALKEKVVEVEPNDLEDLDFLIADLEPDNDLWELLAEKKFAWKTALKILGWDPDLALCAVCNSKKPEYFRSSDQDFFCSLCASKVRDNGLIFIYPPQKQGCI